MAERRQLPPQIKRIELADRASGRPVIRYQLTVDVGLVDGKRKQLRKRFATEREARDALDAVRGDVAKGTYVHPSKVTLADACESWLAAKHGLKPSTLHGHRVNLAAAVAKLGEVEVQKLTKRHIDDLVIALRTGGLPSPTGKSRKPWSPRSVNYMLGLLTAVLRDQMRQGHVVRNVAELVDRIPADAKPAETFTPAELQRVLTHIDGDRYAIAWQLALTGLRRGEVAGLRWRDIDLDARTLQISSTRLRFGKHLIEDTPKSRAGRRTLPIPDHLAATLRTTRAIQAADRLALGEDYEASGFVVVDEAGAELSPHALTSRWARMLKAAGVRHIRFHDARHTCGTLMHLQAVPIAVISAWLGHASKAFTMATYVHSQPDALSIAAQSFNTSMTESGRS
ncbi:site-specific integrase [Mycolicibacterium komossense]|uniref:Tyrosine-type recombinase/integrase n=1 Tax=Mycolicibacterium komossense TaxID=1779 RepID=A0ABT3CLQ6_9MYCO|nr:site-specific integrase [Mycolicibacterium komossense]MCV7230390.1 tyrosine-type recombinase/integrase [Mycolicibacterium komossense]